MDIRNKIRCRNATLSDENAIYELANQLHEKIKIDRIRFNRNFNSIINKDNQFVMVAELNEKVVGYFSANLHLTIYANGNVMYLDEIVVLDSERGKHIGSILMHELERIANRQKCILISLATAGANEFYERLGYFSKANYFKKYMEK